MALERFDAIALYRLDNPPVNALGLAVRQGLAGALDELEADASLQGLVIAGVGKAFSGGADIREFGRPAGTTAPMLSDLIGRIESGNKVVVAAIGGVALGGGFELALGCHFRVASAGAMLGLPEVSLGLIPGAGGTQRLPRLAGIDVALDVIVDGRRLSGEEGVALGVIDQVADDVVADAISLARMQSMPGATPRRTGELSAPALDGTNEEEHLVAARDKVERRMRGLLAPQRAIDAIECACTLPLAEGLVRERALFVECRDSAQSRAQRHLFFAERQAAHLPAALAGATARAVQRVGVVGFGTMGVGIASSLADAGFMVQVVEKSSEARERGSARLADIYQSALAKGRIDTAELAARTARVQVAGDIGTLSECELVIEAVVEELDVKQAVFAELSDACRRDAVLASNTSTLSIDAIAAAASAPERVIGMHFFSPAHIMKLVENVRGEKTSADVIATAMDMAKRLRKVGVLVGNCDGFVGNRMYHCYTRQTYLMLEEGALPEQVDRVMRDFGFAMGPFAVGDLAGLDISWSIRKRRAATRPANEPYSPLADRVCELGRFGQKTRAGWYRYEEGSRAPLVDAAVTQLVEARSAELGLARRSISDDEIRERCIYALINEGARILEEGHAQRASDIDVIWRYGYGFPVARGGPMHYGAEIGFDTVRDALARYAEQQGEVMQPAAWLDEQATSVAAG